MSETILVARGVSKVFRGGGLEVPVLSGIDLTVQPGRRSPLSVLQVLAKVPCCICLADSIRLRRVT
jgi:hypothetical protein